MTDAPGSHRRYLTDEQLDACSIYEPPTQAKG
jgi:hypothetical protein